MKIKFDISREEFQKRKILGRIHRGQLPVKGELLILEFPDGTALTKSVSKISYLVAKDENTWRYNGKICGANEQERIMRMLGVDDKASVVFDLVSEPQGIHVVEWGGGYKAVEMKKGNK